ncbi:putative quinol monooxygenase [Lichenifustis flavocetrariae]|uniref:Antibiotic biosynthesis monooxygenase n=1 Tax=Lichenifustis flavocetrariae TaxID=2949735 RepID=A0AA41YT71_9HYPH|nr:putative quinol monooxygenase [Lichenifustis flavocetrariae]MCW6507704.1 antibiotic biosynthesis monooxygenase [Lichenifustis flavocetrariae]
MIATLTVNADHREAFMAGAREVIAATRQEAGCQHYDLSGSITDPLTFVFVERWDSREALDAHFQTKHLQHWRTLCEKYLTGRALEIIRPEHVDAS